MSRLRLLKVHVQPFFVLDDDDKPYVLEQDGPVVCVSPPDWPTFATTTFLEGMEELQAQLDAQEAVE